MHARLFDIDTALVAPHTVVRRFRENEGEALYNLIQDNRSQLEDHFPKTMEEVRDKESAEFFVRKMLAGWLLQKEFAFGVWENKSAGLIGMIRIFRIDWRVPKAELNYFIDKGHAGKGLMSESVKVVLRFAFHQLQIEKIAIRTAMDNNPSQRLARKMGFRREGDLRADFKKPSGEVIDIMLFGLTRGEFLGI
ncbi:MAG: GNAT family N-acetyltransferase [Phaeodactylibacter sp.]|nr:GNAT family N-acetyltransferase [Phaeodactylibacter sp.]MCB9265127.1 GNAT family N-acetyltransferase [Lewinellaceae bacterium]MCB9289988.1 GNAT family N-acetyltransferase [Lewinellaceae bacterium]